MYFTLLGIKRGAHTNDVVSDVLGGRGLVVSDDESPKVLSACDQSLTMAAARQLTFLLLVARRTTVFGEEGCWKSGVVSIHGNLTRERTICQEYKAITCGAGDHCSKKKILFPRAHHRRHVKVAT